SVHPQSSFAALGPLAADLMAGHDPTCHYGERSPLARLAGRSAKVLLLGVSYEVCTAFHLAEYRVPQPPRRRYECVVAGPGGAGRRWFRYEDVVLDDTDFAVLGGALEASDIGPRVVRAGAVGRAPCRLLLLREAVAFAADWIRANRAPRA